MRLRRVGEDRIGKLAMPAVIKEVETKGGRGVIGG